MISLGWRESTGVVGEVGAGGREGDTDGSRFRPSHEGGAKGKKGARLLLARGIFIHDQGAG